MFAGFTDVAACRAVSNPAGCRIFRQISCFSPLNLGTLFRCCVLGQRTSPSNTSLDSGENDYLVGQRWQCVRWVQCAEMAAGLYALRGVEMAQEWTGPVTRGSNLKSDARSSDLISDYELAPFFFFLSWLLLKAIYTERAENTHAQYCSDITENELRTIYVKVKCSWF